MTKHIPYLSLKSICMPQTPLSCPEFLNSHLHSDKISVIDYQDRDFFTRGSIECLNGVHDANESATVFFAYNVTYF